MTCEKTDKLSEAGQVIFCVVVLVQRSTVVEYKYRWHCHYSVLSIQRMVFTAINSIQSVENNQVLILAIIKISPQLGENSSKSIVMRSSSSAELTPWSKEHCY